MPIIAAEPLLATVRAMCKAAGSSDYEAELVAENLVMANLSGHDSHGVGMLPAYFDNLHAGGLKVNQHAEVVRDEGAVMVVDGNAGFGQVIGKESMDIAIARGAQEASSAKAVAEASDIVMLCMGTSEHVESRMRGENGVIAGLHPGAVVVDFGTSLPGSSRKTT